jgi:hypothetical protein
MGVGRFPGADGDSPPAAGQIGSVKETGLPLARAYSTSLLVESPMYPLSTFEEFPTWSFT